MNSRRSTRTAWTAGLLCVGLLTAACPHADKKPSVTENKPFTVTGEDVRLPEVGPALPFTAKQLKAIDKPSYGTRLLRAVDKGEQAGLAALLVLFRQAGIRIVNAHQGNRIVVDTAVASHAMYLQAGQVAAVAMERPQHGMLGVQGLAQLIGAQIPEIDPTAAAAAVSNYWADAIAHPSSPDERVWASVVMTPDEPHGDVVPEGIQTGSGQKPPSLVDALRTGRNHLVSLVQATLLLSRLRADALVAAEWAKEHPDQPLDEPLEDTPLSAGSDATGKEGVTSLRYELLAAQDKHPCDLDPVPDFVFTGVADVVNAAWEGLRKIVVWQRGASDTTARRIKFVAKATGIADLAATVLNFVMTNVLFRTTLSTTRALPVRTKSAGAEGESFTVDASFRTAESHLEWLNCLRAAIALIGLDSEIPASGPWRDMPVDGYFRTADVTHWVGGGTPIHIADRTDKDGSVRLPAIGSRQPRDLSGVTTSYRRHVPVKVTINPNEFLDFYKDWRLATGKLLADVGDVVTGGAPEVILRKALEVANEAGYWAAKGNIQIVDWGGYPIHVSGEVVAQVANWPIPWKVRFEASRAVTCDELAHGCTYKLDSLVGEGCNPEGASGPDKTRGCGKPLSLSPLGTKVNPSFRLGVIVEPTDSDAPLIGQWNFFLGVATRYHGTLCQNSIFVCDFWVPHWDASGYGWAWDKELSFDVPLGSLTTTVRFASPPKWREYWSKDLMLRGTLTLHFTY